MNSLPDLMLVTCMLDLEPKDDPRILSCRIDGNLTTLVLKDSPPNFRHASAEFLDSWTWKFQMADDAETIIRMYRKTREVEVSGSIFGINNLILTVKEVRTVGALCSRAYPMMMTNAGVFLLHPQLRVRAGDRLVCTVGRGVEYLGGDKEIPCVQVAFGQHWSASQSEIMSSLWDAGH